MNVQGYRCAHNLRSRSSLVLNEITQFWHDWAADEADTELIEQVVACLRQMHAKKTAVCLAHERRPGGGGGWDKTHSGNSASCSDSHTGLSLRQRGKDGHQADEAGLVPTEQCDVVESG